MITLIVYREWQSSYNQRTILKDKEGKVKAIFSSSLRQPKYNTKEITVNCNRFLLDWSNVKVRAKKNLKQKENGNL